MRKFLIASLAGLLLAGPALADDDRRYDRRDDRREWRDDRRDYRDDRRDWRDDRRDWRSDRIDYRDDRNDWRWSGNRYYDPAHATPRGYAYKPWNIGYRLPPAYYGNRYWIADPGRYRLPPPYRGTRWVRIGPDALLIGIGTGVIVQAVRGLYW